jgi:hypothetical protein
MLQQRLLGILNIRLPNIASITPENHAAVYLIASTSMGAVGTIGCASSKNAR